MSVQNTSSPQLLSTNPSLQNSISSNPSSLLPLPKQLNHLGLTLESQHGTN